MGLFGDKSADQLEGLPGSMQGSPLDGIEAIKEWKDSGQTGPGPNSTLDQRISDAAALVKKMQSKGKGDEAGAILADYASQPVPRMILFRATPPGGFEAAEPPWVTARASPRRPKRPGSASVAC
jgi:hypothetical protein